MKSNQHHDSQAEILADGIQKASKISALIKLGKTIGFSVFLILVSLFFFYIGVPWYFDLGIVMIAIVVVILELISYIRTNSVDIYTTNEKVTVTLEPDERLELSIPAVMRYGVIRSYGVLGKGKVLTSENALLITNRAVWALTVPLAGADKVVGSTDIGKWQWLNAWEDISNKLEQMLTTMTLEQVMTQCRAVCVCERNEIKEVKTLHGTYSLRFILKDRGKYGYSIRTKETYQDAMIFFHVAI